MAEENAPEIESRFITSRPDQQEHLTIEIPQGEVPSHYINRYYAAYDVRCAFCPQRQRHRRGFTAQMADGRIALCGIDCAIKHFGKDIADNYEQELEKQIRRESDNAILDRAIAGSSAAHRALSDDLLSDEKSLLDVCTELFFEFRDTGLFSALNDQGDKIVSEDQERVITRQDRSGNERQERITERVPIAQVRAVNVLRAGQNPIYRFARARDELEQLVQMNRPGERSDQLIEDMMQCRKRCLNELKLGIDLFRRYTRLFTVENIAQLTVAMRELNTDARAAELRGRPYGFELRLRKSRADETYRIAMPSQPPDETQLLKPLSE